MSDAQPPQEPNPSMDKKAEKAARRQAKAAAKAERKAENSAAEAELERETLQTIAGFRFFRDGTVRQESFVLSTVVNPRSALLEAKFTDVRERKSRLARGATAVATGGANLLLANKHSGAAQLTIVTEEWTAIEDTKSGYYDAAELAQAETIASAGLRAAHSVPASAAGAAPTEKDPVELLREIKKLHEDGLLTADEFETRRQAIVDRIG